MLDRDRALATADRHLRAGAHAEAERIYRQLLRVEPANAQVWHHLGMACWFQRRAVDAADAMGEAVARAPDDADVVNKLGVILAGAGRTEEALAALARAAALRPGWSEPFVNLGDLLNKLDRTDEAIDAYRSAVALAPDNADLHHMLAALSGRQGDRETARAHYLEALRLHPADAAAHSSLLFLTSYDPELEPAVLLNEHVWWDRLHGQGLRPFPPHDNDRAPERPLRVGYVSPDLRVHPVARFMLPIYEAHDRARFAVYSYTQSRIVDAVSEQLRAMSAGWRVTAGMPDEELARAIRADGIDLLVDLAGHTSNNCVSVFGWRSAPVQLSYLGYPNTTGLAAIRYRVTDAVIDPPGAPGPYVEELLRVEGPWCCWRAQASPEIAPAPCARNGFLTFGSMANLLKLNDGVLDLWAAVLRAVPDARLNLYRNTLTPSAQEHVRHKLQARGVAADRVHMAVVAKDGVGHLPTYGEIDASLDTQPWSGHATVFESLWMGVPMLTLRGARPSGRMSASVLHAVGLDDFVADTPERFVARATELARDPRALVDLRTTLRARMAASPLCDGPGFTRKLEATYREAWRRWCAT